jgi:hypothetical protein
MGDKAAAAVSAETINKTAEICAEEDPDAAPLLKISTHVDDIVCSTPIKLEAIQLTQSTTKLPEVGGFNIKHWLFSGESEPRKDLNLVNATAEHGSRTHVLRVGWEPFSDKLETEVKLNFAHKRKGSYTKPILTADDVPGQIPNILTRRMVHEQTMKIYDSLGNYTAFTLRAKIFLREAWELRLGWDDLLPSHLKEQCYC